ncbi:MAG: FkbM family methyltransferase [Clostridia bacterium]|nr:FkbM family methyltransferase [Clostridia bacterium]
MTGWENYIEGVELPRKGQRVFVWGAGNTARLAHEGMKREGLYEALGIEGFVDRAQAGHTLFGLPVGHPDALSRDAFVLICTANRSALLEIDAALNRMGISHCPLEAAILKLRRNEVLQAAALLDEASREIYHRLLLNRLTLDTVPPELYHGESYFGIPEFCKSRHDDVVIDCGAYVGDSAERFIWRMEMFRHYIAIEPDEGNFRAMQRRFKRLREEWNFPEDKLMALNCGVDDVTSSRALESRVGGLGSMATEGCGSTPFWAIDDLAHKIPEMVSPTFIKADIESYEFRMLSGAKETLRTHKPRLAICIYHNMVDMYSIPLLIHSIEPGYRFAVRHHSYGYEETVLYAY